MEGDGGEETEVVREETILGAGCPTVTMGTLFTLESMVRGVIFPLFFLFWGVGRTPIGRWLLRNRQDDEITEVNAVNRIQQ